MRSPVHILHFLNDLSYDPLLFRNFVLDFQFSLFLILGYSLALCHKILQDAFSKSLLSRSVR